MDAMGIYRAYKTELFNTLALDKEESYSPGEAFVPGNRRGTAVVDSSGEEEAPRYGYSPETSRFSLHRWASETVAALVGEDRILLQLSESTTGGDEVS